VLKFAGPLGHAWQTSEELVRGRSGALHMLGAGQRRVPVVVSVAASSDPLQASSWVWQPPNATDNTGLPADYSPIQVALDWPRQTLWAAWVQRDKLYVGHAPVGTTNWASVSGWEVAPQDGGKIYEFRLASSDGGADAICYRALGQRGSSRLVFHWLLPNGLGETIQLARPGTQTEAADFAEVNSNTMCLHVAPDGVAHFLVKARKRGEYPANAPRLYYARISGGAVLSTEPAVGGGGTQTVDSGTGTQTGGQQGDWTAAGGKPDLIARLELDRQPYLRDGNQVYRYYRFDSSVSPKLLISNLGAQYFGDVQVRIVIDGVTINYRWLDESGHMRPLIERNGTITEYSLPILRYEFRPTQPWQPPQIEMTHKMAQRTISVWSGLGRKRATVIVDPDNEIAEANEDNNVCELQYEISDGSDMGDRTTVTDIRGQRQTVGLNDLAILGAPKLFANTHIARPGLLQRPTSARLIVGNPRGAMFFRQVPVVALLDGQPIWRHTIELLDNERRLYNRDTAWYGYTAPPRRSGPEVMGGFLDIPVDLTGVAVGAHTLTIVVDPEDQCADLQRDNNSASINFQVREPGGTLRLRVRDRDSNLPLALAHFLLPELYFGICDEQGEAVVADLPAGDYRPTQLLASRPYPAPRYGQQPAPQGFTITRGQETTLTVLLEAPVHVIVSALDAQTGEPVPEVLQASLRHLGTPWDPEAEGCAVPRSSLTRVHFEDVAPGDCEVTASAYAYRPQRQTVAVHRDANGECHVQLALPRAPRGQITGTVVDADGRPVADADVWLNDAPRATTTDNAGNFVLSEVEAGRAYLVVAMKRSYLPDAVLSATVPGNGACSVQLRCPKVTDQTKSLSVDCIAWAQVESWPGFSFGPLGSPDYRVSAEHGKFTATLGMLYRQVQSQRRVIVDQIVLGTAGKEFWNANVSTTYNAASVLSSAIACVSGSDIARLATLAEPLAQTLSMLQGDVDPSQMRGGKVVGTYTSQTGADYDAVALLPLGEIPVGVGFQGGQTVVRTDMLQISDGSKTRTVRRQWYSPQSAAYRIGEDFAADSLEVRCYVAVLNEQLSPGPLYASSKNVIRWRPLEDQWLRFEPSDYDPLGLE